MGINKPRQRKVEKWLYNALAGDFKNIITSHPQIDIPPLGGRRKILLWHALLITQAEYGDCVTYMQMQVVHFQLQLLRNFRLLCLQLRSSWVYRPTGLHCVLSLPIHWMSLSHLCSSRAFLVCQSHFFCFNRQPSSVQPGKMLACIWVIGLAVQCQSLPKSP